MRYPRCYYDGMVPCTHASRDCRTCPYFEGDASLNEDYEYETLERLRTDYDNMDPFGPDMESHE